MASFIAYSSTEKMKKSEGNEYLTITLFCCTMAHPFVSYFSLIGVESCTIRVLFSKKMHILVYFNKCSLFHISLQNFTYVVNRRT